MKKRNQKLNLNRETVARLERLHLKRIAGDGVVADRDAVGYMTSCGYECGCPDEFGTY